MPESIDCDILADTESVTLDVARFHVALDCHESFGMADALFLSETERSSFSRYVATLPAPSGSLQHQVSETSKVIVFADVQIGSHQQHTQGRQPRMQCFSQLLHIICLVQGPPDFSPVLRYT
jgi:hypothetical protein